jgi:POT family proton-dependent oligopeptide transporter
MQTLRRVAGPLNWIAFSVAFVELCERFSYYGTTAVCKSRLQLGSRDSATDDTISQLSTSFSTPFPPVPLPVPLSII